MESNSGSRLKRVFLAEASLVNSQAMEQALRRRLPSDIFAIESCALTSREVSEILRRNEPDITLISENLADGPQTGFNVLRAHRDLWATRRVVMLLDRPTRETVIDAFRHGAHGVFQRSADLNVLCRCIRAVAAGQVWANSAQLQWLLQALAASAAPVRALSAKGLPILSPREETIVGLVIQGLTNREIGASLSLSEHTIRNYVYRIYNKIGVSSRVELTFYIVSRRQLEKQVQENVAINVAS